MKCCPCTDQLIADGGSTGDDLPDAITWVPMMQAVPAGSVMVTGLVVIPVCFACRVTMLRGVSKTGLATA